VAASFLKMRSGLADWAAHGAAARSAARTGKVLLSGPP
jgi:hypothetical protein